MEIGGRKNVSNDSDCLRRSCRYSVSGVGCNADKEFLGGVEAEMNIEKLPLKERLEYLNTCISILPQTKERIISGEDYRAYQEVVKRKRGNETGIFTSSKLDIACADSDTLDIVLQLLKELKGRMNQELND